MRKENPLFSSREEILESIRSSHFAKRKISLSKPRLLKTIQSEAKYYIDSETGNKPIFISEIPKNK